MEVNQFNDLDLYQRAFEIEQIGNEAVSEVKQENRQKGIPLVFAMNDNIYYELPDGTITTDSPFKK